MVQKAIPIQMKGLVANGEWIIRLSHLSIGSGFDVESILDGRTAQARLKETIPNVIVLDMHLPYVDGPSLLKQIRADERLSKVRIIIATADSNQAEFYRNMATIVMVKPITFSQLRDISARFKVE